MAGSPLCGALDIYLYISATAPRAYGVPNLSPSGVLPPLYLLTHMYLLTHRTYQVPQLQREEKKRAPHIGAIYIYIYKGGEIRAPHIGAINIYTALRGSDT